MGDLEGVGVVSFMEDGAAFIVILGLLALQFAPLLVELLLELGFYFPPRLVVSLLPVVQKVGLEKTTGVHLGHKAVHLVIVFDRDPMVFALDLVHVLLSRKVGGVRFWIVTQWRKEVGFYG